ncbi:MAG: OmpA family protein [Desulfobulbus sp.]|jgi:chemotaxis protein MotB|uniref:OmpA family protein n=1 Tax=Desulfobulbus sp. TaxID=895 RepID=UPI0028466E5C|nr:OmpA family protein [Desulfobulbus sp.]MDR2550851.1 OmpA family protein [Desulfobulbus sp.]
MAETSFTPPAPDEAQESITAAPSGRAPSSLPPEWLHASQPVFVVEDSFYRSRTPPRPVHWSIAWSDLMMTMFILFLTLFAHLHTHQEIVSHGKPNKVADETVPINAGSGKSSLLFHPITQDISLKLGDKQHETSLPKQELQGADVLIRHQTAELPQPAAEQRDPIPEVDKPPAEPSRQHAEAPAPALEPEQAADLKQREEAITKIYDLSKHTLENEKLERFASVELVPDKTMRIILTGDLLFDSGQAELTHTAIDSLKKLSNIIKETPYMINVIGHTDDRPVKTTRFPSNWELSLARASRVARFLIEETKLPPSQFAVAGYSSFRPLHPNTSEENRKANRRVEIILSKELPQAQAATPTNLQ